MSGKKPLPAIAHIVAQTRNIEKTTEFYRALGLRKIWESKEMSILELRGGTHILFFKQSKPSKRPPSANFDLMVDDLPRFRARLKKLKLPVGALREHRRSGHQMFEAEDPDGRRITICSSHTEGRAV